MPAVRANSKSQAKDFYHGGPRGRGRRAKGTCSRFVLAVIMAVGVTWAKAGMLSLQVKLAGALPTVNGPERSVSRASEAAAKLPDTASASITLGWR
jgi:hypothetical protein